MAVEKRNPDESEAERLDRNWNEILQELRVTQTGTQILTGFLLTIPFQQRFTELDDVQRTIYLVLVAFAALATILALAPVSIHRTLFRQGAKPQIVAVTNRLLIGALISVAITLIGTSWLIFDVVVGHPAGITAGIVTALLTASAWFALPRISARRG
jgi:hypothetical protein